MCCSTALLSSTYHFPTGVSSCKCSTVYMCCKAEMIISLQRTAIAFNANGRPLSLIRLLSHALARYMTNMLLSRQISSCDVHVHTWDAGKD